MPRTEVVFYQEEDGTVPIVDWLDDLPVKARIKCLARLARLEELGHELRRPEADLLREGIYECGSDFRASITAFSTSSTAVGPRSSPTG